QFLTKSNQNTTNQQQNQQNPKQTTDSRASTGPGPSKTNSGFFGSVQRKDSASSTSTVNSQTSVPKQRREFVNSKYPSNSSIASWSSNQSQTNYTNFYGKNENNTRGTVEQKNEKKNESGKNSYANSDAESTKSGSSTSNFGKKPINVQNSVKNNANQQVPKPVIPSKTISTGSNPGNSSIQMKVVNNQNSSKINKSPTVPTVKPQTTVINPVVSPVKAEKVEPYLVITPNNASSGPKSNVSKIPSAPVDPYLVITSSNPHPEPKRVVPVIPPAPVDPKPASSRPLLTTPTKTQNQTPKRPP
uniref:Enamelin n=1 Tax=Panagrolaimus sp. JU765 TaxID=591449 RepID=A0AC34R8P5_9BILA